MLKVLIAGSAENCLTLYKNIKWDKLDCEVVGQTQSGKNAYEKAFAQNVDAVIADFWLDDCDGLTFLDNIRERTEEIKVILCIGQEELTHDEDLLKSSKIEYVLKPFEKDEFEHISMLLEKYKYDKQITEYLSFILTDKKFEDEVLRNLIKNNTDYFDGVFKNISAADKETVIVKFACLKMINIAYEYFDGLGFKGIKVQKTNASKSLMELKNVGEIIEYTKSQYMNIMQFDNNKNTDFYISIAKKIKEYIGLNYKNPELCVSGISALFHFSPNYLNDIFKNQAEMSIPKYIINVRMNKARTLLITTKMSIKDIAFAVGYEKANYFPRIFKKQFNVSPLEYRKKFGKVLEDKGGKA